MQYTKKQKERILKYMIDEHEKLGPLSSLTWIVNEWLDDDDDEQIKERLQKLKDFNEED